MKNPNYRAELPPLPPLVEGRRIEVTDGTYIAWDVMEPWRVTGVAFLRGNEGEFTVWTPGRLSHWVWRGPRHVTRENSRLLARWLTQDQNNHDDKETDLKASELAEVHENVIWVWDPHPNLEGGLGFLRLGDVGFELSLMMGGLVRGRSHIGREDADLLAKWLIKLPVDCRHIQSEEI